MARLKVGVAVQVQGTNWHGRIGFLKEINKRKYGDNRNLVYFYDAPDFDGFLFSDKELLVCPSILPPIEEPPRRLARSINRQSGRRKIKI